MLRLTENQPNCSPNQASSNHPICTSEYLSSRQANGIHLLHGPRESSLAYKLETGPRAAHGLINLLKGGHPPYHVRLPCLTYK